MDDLVAAEKTAVVAVVDMQATDPDPVFLPTALLVGVITMPLMRRNDEHASTLDLDPLFGRLVKPTPSLRNIDQLVVVKYASFMDIEIIVAGVPGRGGG